MNLNKYIKNDLVCCMTYITTQFVYFGWEFFVKS